MKNKFGGIASFFCPQCGNQTFALLGEINVHDIKELIGAECLDCKREITEKDILVAEKQDKKKIIKIAKTKKNNPSVYAQAV